MISKSAMPAKVAGSVALTPKSKDEISRVSPPGAGEPDRHSDERQAKSAAHHRSDQGAGRRDERDPHSQLVRALAHEVGHHPVDPDGGEQPRRRR